MSSLLLSNPFVTQPSHTQPATEEPHTSLAVIPSQGASHGSASGNATAFSGGRRGGGLSTGAQALISQGRSSGLQQRPSEAASEALFDAVAEDFADIPFGSNLPKVEMPDPLPTSPFLKSLREDDS